MELTLRKVDEQVTKATTFKSHLYGIEIDRGNL